MINDIKKLDAKEHILKYPDAFLGSVIKSTVPRLCYHPKDGLKYITGYTSAAVRCFKEVIDNSLDAAIRIKFKKGTNIKVSFNNKGFVVEDDGHGVPIKFNEKENMWSPQLAFSEERAGSNFEVDERSTVGMYGVGVFAVNVVSTSLELITCDGKQVYSQLFGGNCNHMTEPEISKVKRRQPSGTYVSVELDKGVIQWNRRDIYCCLQLINNIMFVYPEISILADIDGEDIELLRGDKYHESLGIDPWFQIHSDSIRGVFGLQDDHSDITGLVNGTECSGIHISHLKAAVSGELVTPLAKEIQDVSRGDISKILSGVVSFRIINPAFGGLTKNELTGCDVDILKSSINEVLPEMVKELSNCVEFKDAVELLVSKRLNRKLKTKERKAAKGRKSLKLVDVYSRSRKKEKTYLLITEGDSAKGLFLQARNPAKHAIYPLRGKILNAVSADDADVVARNKVLFELATILGLSLTDENIQSCRYDYIVSLTDADADGDNICGLLYGFLHQFWPDLFDQSKVLRLCTPSHIDVTKRNRSHYYGSPPKRIRGHLEYIKGLASLTIEDVRSILKDPKFEVMQLDEAAERTIEVVLGKSAEKKRIWLSQ